MSLEEFKQLVAENEISQMVIELYLSEKGIVCITESQYENMEVIDQDGDVP